MLFKRFATLVLGAVLSLSMPLLPGNSIGSVKAGVLESEVLFRRKAWEVSLVAFDDGTFACMAEVGNNNTAFLIWAYSSDRASLQFYNKAWQFNNETADIVVKIDRRADWTLNNAEMNENSVFFTLNDSDTSVRFMREVMLGNVLNLMTSRRQLIERYSLAGSSASIVKLSECVDLLGAADNDSNPFN